MINDSIDVYYVMYIGSLIGLLLAMSIALLIKDDKDKTMNWILADRNTMILLQLIGPFTFIGLTTMFRYIIIFRAEGAAEIIKIHIILEPMFMMACISFICILARKTKRSRQFLKQLTQ